MRLDLEVPHYWIERGPAYELPQVLDLFHSLTGLRQTASRPLRQYDLILGNPQRSEIDWVIELPPGYKVSHVPAPLELQTPYGRVRFETSVSEDSVRVQRTLAILSSRVPAHDYPIFKAFVDAVERAGEDRIQLRKIESTP